MRKSKEILDMTDDKLDVMIENYSRATDSKVLSKDEDREIASQLVSFSRALKKCGNGHIVPQEFKNTVKEFEKVDFDFTKLPFELKKSIDSTYNDFKSVNPSVIKGTSAETYCRIYEFFGNTKNRKFIERIRKDPTVKKSGLTSTETLDAESFEEFLADKERSEELFGLGGLISAVTTSAASVGEGAAVAGSIISNIGIFICIIFSAILVCLIALVAINIAYKIELANILKRVIADNENTPSDVAVTVGDNYAVSLKGAKKSREDTVALAVQSLDNNTNILTKNFFYKPANASLKALSKLMDKGYVWMDNILKSAKNAKSKEELAVNNEQSEEIAIPAAVAGAVSSISTAISGALAAMTPLFIILLIILIVMMIKPAVYFIYHTKMKIGEFFKDESEMLSVNVEELMKLRDETHDEKERDRLSKIIKRQQNVCRNLSALANLFYKTQQEAANDTRDEMREDDRIDYDKLVSGDAVPDVPSDGYNPKLDPMNPNSTGSNKPTIIF